MLNNRAEDLVRAEVLCTSTRCYKLRPVVERDQDRPEDTFLELTRCAIGACK